jgi:hypothetical protein
MEERSRGRIAREAVAQSDWAWCDAVEAKGASAESRGGAAVEAKLLAGAGGKTVEYGARWKGATRVVALAGWLGAPDAEEAEGAGSISLAVRVSNKWK